MALLSYRPCQLRGFLQRALMTLIFADLEQTYPPRLVNLPDSPVAAADGRFLLMERDVILGLGGIKL